MIVVLVVVLVHIVRKEVMRLGRHMRTEPGSSSNDQCHAHENCKLVYWADELAPGRSHHPQDSLHMHIRPRRNPHMRLDGSKNFAA